MNNKIKSEKYSKLSIASLVTGILAIIPVPFFIYIDSDFAIPQHDPYAYFLSGLLLFVIMFYALPLVIAAIVCGSKDLKRVKASRYSYKGWKFDVAGIVLGSIIILNIALAWLISEFPEVLSFIPKDILVNIRDNLDMFLFSLL